ncbi:MAG: efflux RND transporter permease subunit, partial [Acidobacteria bacterium]|nr:efflux RND transporter permease subunit [Candidatus Sulfomarinibacter sp. MAG AM2]
MDRILGYLPPDKFLRRVGRIRTGDSFLACLNNLEEDPGNIEAIQRSVDGLLERSDPEGAINRIEAFHRATDGNQLEICRGLMFTARVELHARVYQRAAKLYRRGWDRGFEVPNTQGTAELHALVLDGLPALPPDDQAALLREARYEDAGGLLEIPDLEARMVRPVLFSFRTPIEVEIHGDNLVDLRRMSERVAEVMDSMPELADVETSQRAGAPEVQIEYDREQLARYGLNIEEVAAGVRDAVKGAEA